MNKNYIQAIVISLAILIGYPFLLKWFNPPQPQAEQPQTVATEEAAKQPEATTPLSPVEGKFLEQAAQPTVVSFENELYEIEFSTLGGTITHLFYKGDPGRQELTHTEFFNTDPLSAGTFGVDLRQDKADLSSTLFKLTRRGPTKEIFEFSYQLPGEYEIVKTFVIHDDKPVIDLFVQIKNISSGERLYPLKLTYNMDHEKDFQKSYGYYDAATFDEKLQTADLGKLKKKGFVIPEGAIWGGTIKKYFALFVKPDWTIEEGSARANDKTITSSITLQSIELRPGAQDTRKFLIYAGPQNYKLLKSFGCEFESVFSRGFFGPFKTILMNVLRFFYGFTHNYGWAIVLLTLLIKLIFAPLTHISYSNMKKMQAVAPKQKAIQERYKKEPGKAQQEIMALYKRNKINPLMGCLPMLIQIPVFIAMFRLLPEAIELHGAPFIFWIHDLSAPDRLFMLPFTVPLLGWNSFNALPILMALSQLWYQKIMPQQPGASPEQAKIMGLMPIFFGFICYNMPSGLTLYWTLQNMFSIIQQVFINRVAIAIHHEDK